MKITPGSHTAYTKLSMENGCIIYISKDNMDNKHVLAHEITHSQIPVCNRFFAEGFASLISCNISGNCNPFWFNENKVSDVVKNYFKDYIGLHQLINDYSFFDDFSKFSTRLAHVTAAAFIEWAISTLPNFAKNIVNHLNEEYESMLFDKYQYSIPTLEQKWLKFLGTDV